MLEKIMNKFIWWKRTHVKDVVIPCLNMNHTYKRKNGIKFTKFKQEIIVIMELSPEDGGYAENWIIAEKKGDKYDCNFQTTADYTNLFLKNKFNISNSSFKELFKLYK